MATHFVQEIIFLEFFTTYIKEIHEAQWRKFEPEEIRNNFTGKTSEYFACYEKLPNWILRFNKYYFNVSD